MGALNVLDTIFADISTFKSLIVEYVSAKGTIVSHFKVPFLKLNAADVVCSHNVHLLKGENKGDLP